MKYLIFLCLISFSYVTYSDNHMPKTYGMEGWQCNFDKGKDLDDLKRFTKKFNPYADKNWNKPYSSFILTPFLRSEEEVNFDVAWVGFTNNHVDLGNIQDSWFATGGNIAAEFESITDCNTIGYYIAAEAREPTVPFEEGKDAYFAIYSCSFKEGKSGLDLAANDKSWNEYNDNRGFTGGVWRWWPGPGTSNSFEGDFLMNISFNSMEELGQYLDDRLRDSFAGTRPESILNCDNPRVYTAYNARNRPFEDSQPEESNSEE